MSKKPATLNKPYANRVIGAGEEDPEQLLANPANFRIHPDNQQQALAGSIDGIGWIDPVIVNKRSGHVVDGHLRVTLALRSGVKSIPVTYVDLDEAEEAQALLSLDPIAAMAATDKQQLDALLRQIQSDDERVQAMVSEIAENEGIVELQSLDDLGEEYGEHDETYFWPVIRMQVSPDVKAAFERLWKDLPGGNDSERMNELVSNYGLQ